MPAQELIALTVAMTLTESGAEPEDGVTWITPEAEGELNADAGMDPDVPVLPLAHCWEIAEAVRGPTTPQPVVAGLPEETMP